jgi:hypothetical protein
MVVIGREDFGNVLQLAWVRVGEGKGSLFRDPNVLGGAADIPHVVSSPSLPSSPDHIGTDPSRGWVPSRSSPIPEAFRGSYFDSRGLPLERLPVSSGNDSPGGRAPTVRGRREGSSGGGGWKRGGEAGAGTMMKERCPSGRGPGLGFERLGWGSERLGVLRVGRRGGRGSERRLAGGFCHVHGDDGRFGEAKRCADGWRWVGENDPGCFVHGVDSEGGEESGWLGSLRVDEGGEECRERWRRGDRYEKMLIAGTRWDWGKKRKKSQLVLCIWSWDHGSASKG